MARPKSPEKHDAILTAAAEEIAVSGLGVATAKIARRAGIAEGTLFTYFPTKDDLLNALYIHLKVETYLYIHRNFPVKGSLEERARHVWSSYIAWLMEFPVKRQAMAQLSVSGIITPATRTRAAAGREEIERLLTELDKRALHHGLPTNASAVLMLSMQEATLELIARTSSKAKKNQLIEAAFAAFWRAVR
jgi:AcrR family transcriptional regulator